MIQWLIVLLYGESIQGNCVLWVKSMKIGTKVAFCMSMNLWVSAKNISGHKSNMTAKFKMATINAIMCLIIRFNFQ